MRSRWGAMSAAGQREPGSARPWPNVPACYGWLALDRRGVWRLQGEPVHHAGLNAYLGKNYRRDDSGCWVVHNGPQKVFVALDYAPWVFRLMPEGVLLTHTGVLAGAPTSIHVDEEGAILLLTPTGPGLLDDRDLAEMLADCVTESGAALDEDMLDQAITGCTRLSWRGLPIGAIRREEAASRLGFIANPTPPETATPA